MGTLGTLDTLDTLDIITGTDAPGFHKWVRHAKCTWSSSYSKGYYYLCLTPTCPLSCSNWQSSSMRATTLSSSIPPASKTPLSNIFDDPSYIYTLLMGEYCGVYMIFVFHESHMNLNQNQFSHGSNRSPDIPDNSLSFGKPTNTTCNILYFWPN